MLEGFVVADVERKAIAFVEPVAAADRRIETEDVVQIVVMTTAARGLHVRVGQARARRQIEIKAAGQRVAELQAKVRNRGFLLRRFPDDPRIADRLRISMGMDEEMDELLSLL